MTGKTDALDARLSLRDVLCGIWHAKKYPIRGNEDSREAAPQDVEALERAGRGMMSPRDQPEFADWMAALRRSDLPGSEHDRIMDAIHDLFEPDE